MNAKLNIKKWLFLTLFVFPSLLLTAAEKELWKTIPEPIKMKQTTQSGLLAINGISVYYAIYGQGTPVILLHGGLGHSGFWANQVSEIAKSHQVILIDSRGHGRTTRDNQVFSYSLMTLDVLGVMDALKINKADVVGWSDGGVIGLELAINHPKRINKLITFGTNYNLNGVKPSVEKDPVFGEYVGISARDYSQLSKTPKEFNSFVEAISHMWHEQPNYLPAQLKSITTPILILQAEYDEAIKTEHAVEMASLIPNAKLTILKNVSHFAPWQDPQLFNQKMIDFLDEGI